MLSDKRLAALEKVNDAEEHRVYVNWNNEKIPKHIEQDEKFQKIEIIWN